MEITTIIYKKENIGKKIKDLPLNFLMKFKITCYLLLWSIFQLIQCTYRNEQVMICYGWMCKKEINTKLSTSGNIRGLTSAYY